MSTQAGSTEEQPAEKDAHEQNAHGVEGQDRFEAVHHGCARRVRGGEGGARRLSRVRGSYVEYHPPSSRRVTRERARSIILGFA